MGKLLRVRKGDTNVIDLDVFPLYHNYLTRLMGVEGDLMTVIPVSREFLNELKEKSEAARPEHRRMAVNQIDPECGQAIIIESLIHTGDLVCELKVTLIWKHVVIIL